MGNFGQDLCRFRRGVWPGLQSSSAARENWEGAGVARNKKLRDKVQKMETRTTAISGAVADELLSFNAYLNIPKCESCGSRDIESEVSSTIGQPDLYRTWYKCKSCGNEWTEGP